MEVTSRRKDKLFVFAVPHILEFCMEERINDAKSFTLMNCYEFPIKFKILWTTKNKYFVTPTEFVMQPTTMGQCYVKYVPGAPANYDIYDNINILMYDCSTNKVLGKGSVQVQLLRHKKSMTDNNESRNVAENKPVSQATNLENTVQLKKRDTRAPMVLGAILLMSLILYLPVEGENVDTIVPAFLHVSHTCKLFFSFLFGFLCCFLFMRQ